MILKATSKRHTTIALVYVHETRETSYIGDWYIAGASGKGSYRGIFHFTVWDFEELDPSEWNLAIMKGCYEV